MNTQTVEYKAKVFEPRYLVSLLLITSALPMLLFTPFVLGLLPWPGETGQSLGSKLVLIVMALLYTAPVVVPMILTAMAEGKQGVKTSFRHLWKGSLSIQWFLVAALLWPTIFLVINLLARTLEGRESFPIFRSIDVIQNYFIPGFFGVLLIAVFEEFCWRGYALPRLQVKWNALISSLVLGVFWALMHLPNWFMPPGNPTRADSFLTFAGQIILTSILYTWIYNNMNGNLLGVILAHNMSNSIGALIQVPETFQIYQNWVLLAMVILVVVFYGPRDLIRQKRDKVIEQEKVRVMGD